MQLQRKKKVKYGTGLWNTGMGTSVAEPSFFRWIQSQTSELWH